ncbi:hypothetical protein LIER_12025 [Lithospermum erythrorhizon]|uniref:HMA domain-containing protein n=1 Tax=Lithospermum erythrorhizon TaxID=34254 RepID=A0AAV3PVF1_LITER
MGEKVEEHKKGEGEKKVAEAPKKDDNAPAPIVLKLDLHCEGCAKKVKRAVRHYEGVQDVKADASSNKLTVKGNVDPIWLRDKVATKTKKKVELVSPQPKKDGGAAAGGGGGDDKKPVDNKVEKKKEEKKPEDNKPKESTVVLKIQLHCDGCAHKIKRIISKFDGVDHVSIDHQKDLVTVKGTMDVKELAHYLKEKLKRGVEIVPPKKEDGGDKKEKEGGGGGGDKKEGGGGGDKKEGGAKGAGGGGEGGKNEAPKVEANKYEYNGYNPYTYYANPPMYNHNYSNQDYGMSMYHNQSHPSTSHHVVEYPHMPETSRYVANYAQMPETSGYAANYPYSHMPETSGYASSYSHMPPPMPSYLHAPQMFSDENPNACSIM